MTSTDTHFHGQAFPDPEPLPPPSWARSQGPDSGGIAHETNVYLVPKAIRHLDVNRDELIPVQVSMSVIDRRVDDGWVRLEPTIDLEGGNYSLDAARRLCAAIKALLDVAEEATV